MGKFLAGILVGVGGLAAGAYIYVHYGFLDMRADRAASRIEHIYMRGAMDKSVDRHAPKMANPVPPSDVNLIEGIRLYKSNCAVCHGGPEMPNSKVGEGFSPPTPQFLKEAPDMPDNQNYWIVKHGVKMTGMPAWDKVLSDTDIWKLTTFLGQMKDLNKSSPAVQAAWAAGGQTELGPAAPVTPPNPPLSAPPERLHQHRHRR
jgi:mono/diheme cytochrome c family protein